MKDNTNASWESYLQGPRWAGISHFLLDGRLAINDIAAYRYPTKLEWEYFQEDKKLFTTTVYFKINGPIGLVEPFRNHVVETARRYNA